MNSLETWRALMLGAALTFCISQVQSLPVYPYPSPGPTPGFYVPTIDPYSVPYQSVDPYAVPYPSVDPYAVPYPSVDPYAVPYPSVDPYGLPQQQQSIYGLPYGQPTPSPVYVPTVDAYYQAPPSPSPYPSVDSPYNVPQQQNYALAPSIPQIPAQIPYQSQVVVEEDIYQAITYHEMGEAKHCGVVSATNDALYTGAVPGGINDVVPYGSIPWNLLIVDNDDNNVVCLGSRLHTGLTLTHSSCINGPASKYSVVHDWDILTIYNEYEPYKSVSSSVCSIWPVGIDNSSQPVQYMLGGPYSELTLLITSDLPSDDKYPAFDWLCLPSKSSNLPVPSPYNQPYGYPQPSPYTPYPQIAYSSPDYGYPPSNAECWVAGYRSSPTAILQNHPLPTPAANQPPNPYQQQYYNILDNSKVPRKALVRQVQCPSGYPSPGYLPYDDVCFVGVVGYDACVADKGAAIFCVVGEDAEYDSGFANDQSSNLGSIPAGSSAPSQPNQQQQPQQQIQAQAAPPKEGRKRAVLYAVVKAPTSCYSPQQPAPYQGNQQQSNYVVATRVSPDIRGAIVDLQWQAAYVFSCPAEKVQDVIPRLGTSSLPPGVPVPQVQYPSALLQPSLYDSSLIYDPSQQYQPPPPYQQQPVQVPSYQQQPVPQYQPQPAPVYQQQQVPVSSYPQPSMLLPSYQYSDPVSYSPVYNPYPQQGPILQQQYPIDLYGIV
ncbi:hypothetical protein Ocin01_03415 [Orchesella cincta]|uniref:Uncharacterized protein n=1 Tax=Orchesella cincta TaxID=48709 RepID=A0A1D2NDT5_ORCCI|nr:hypothetical protein Ocin01_03415 [Orchesella cincta]